MLPDERRPQFPPEDPRDCGEPRLERRPCALLAVDLGLRTGLAAFDRSGALLWHRSRHLRDMATLKRWIHGLLRQLPHTEALVLEGGGPVAHAWKNAAERRGLRVIELAAEDWREELLYPRQRRSGEQAKAVSQNLAREIAAKSGLPRPATLRHDAAEAILAGVYALQLLGWPA